MEKNEWKIVLLGAGNVGYHLGKQLKTCGLNLVQIFSRQESKAQQLSAITDVPYVTRMEYVMPNADLYILAVNDSAISIVADQLKIEHGLVVHTSGGTSSTVLQPHFQRFGAFYPLQTFSISRKIIFDNIPICVFAKTRIDEDFLFKIGTHISQKVYRIGDEQRTMLHIAAVFVNNFVNHLFQIGYDILEKEKLHFDLLRPLILETALKVQDHLPKEMQTGPARRGDVATVERHLQYLEAFPSYLELYKSITKDIQSHSII